MIECRFCCLGCSTQTLLSSTLETHICSTRTHPPLPSPKSESDPEIGQLRHRYIYFAQLGWEKVSGKNHQQFSPSLATEIQSNPPFYLRFMRGTYNIFVVLSAFPSVPFFLRHTLIHSTIFWYSPTTTTLLTFNFWHAVNCNKARETTLFFPHSLTFVNTFWIVRFLYTIFYHSPHFAQFWFSFGNAVEMI